MPDNVSVDKVGRGADLRWLKPLDSLHALHIELPMSSSPGTPCTFASLSCLTQLQSVTLVSAQPQHLDDLGQLPNLMSLHLLRYRGAVVPSCLETCQPLQQLTLELHSIPMQSEVRGLVFLLRGMYHLLLTG